MSLDLTTFRVYGHEAQDAEARLRQRMQAQGPSQKCTCQTCHDFRRYCEGETQRLKTAQRRRIQ
jgi:hypothetical protein